jgi:hypothetical protein
MLYWKIIALSYEIVSKEVDTMCEHKVELLNTKPGGT